MNPNRLTARAAPHAVGGDNVTDGRWLSVGYQAKKGQGLSDEQIDECGCPLTWLNKTFGVPIQMAKSKIDKGLGTHAMFGNSDHDCPGKSVVAQMSRVIEADRSYYVA